MSNARQARWSCRLTLACLLASGVAACTAKPDGADGGAAPAPPVVIASPPLPDAPQAPPAAAPAASPQPEVLAEVVDALLLTISSSNLAFFRNGTQHTGVEAAQHIRSKYEHFKDDITTPEQFIEKAAARSLLTGQPYLVQLADGSRQPLTEWLTARLAELRAAR